MLQQLTATVNHGEKWRFEPSFLGGGHLVFWAHPSPIMALVVLATASASDLWHVKSTYFSQSSFKKRHNSKVMPSSLFSQKLI